ncbi:MAG TPA: TonB-dependent receptor [Chitinophagaceae bacterium]|nr:TonB-dependent receptor [Chitinophagaceae bacterium]
MRILFSLALLLVLPGLSAQMLTISGLVRDAQDRQALASCSVTVLNGAQGTRTDGRGRFTLTVPAQSSIIISFSGYGADTVSAAVLAQQPVVLLQPLQRLLEDVVVTGVSRATLVRENPVAVSRVSARSIDRAIEPNIIDALVRNVPGLNAVKTGPNISKPFIRGLGYNRVLTLYDGIRQEGQQWGDEHGIEVDGYNIEKAEVIKGPASLMFGSDALAGVVSLFPTVPKQQDGRLHGRVLSEYQHNNGLLGLGARLGYHNGHWWWIARGAQRIAKNYRNAVDGWVYNTGFRETNASVAVGFLTARGNSQWNISLYDNLQGIPDGSRDSLSRRFTYQVAEGNLDDIAQRPLVAPHLLKSYTLSPLHQHIQHYRLYSNHHYNLGKGALDATLGFQQNVRREYSHPTAPGQAGLHVRLRTINYGLSYHLPRIKNMEFTAGINGMYQQNSSREATDFPVPNYHLLDVGGFLYGKWKQGDLTVSGGLRYDTRQLKGKDLFVTVSAANGFGRQVFPPDTMGAVQQFTAFNKSFTGLSLSLGTAYQFTEHFSGKLNIARGYRSPNITEFAANGLDPGAHIIYLGNQQFVPEFSWQQDIGLTAEYAHLDAAISIFNNHIQHYIYLSQLADAQGNPLTDAQGNKTFQYQQGAAHLYGAEASLTIRPSFIRGCSFANSMAITYGNNQNTAYKNAGVNGEYLPLIPPLKWLSSLSQELSTTSKIFTSVQLKAEIEHSAAQERYLALFNTETATPAYTLFSIAAGTSIAYAKQRTLQCQLQVNNLFNQAYQSHLSRLKYFEYYSASPNNQLGMFNVGRSVCFKMIIDF